MAEVLAETGEVLEHELRGLGSGRLASLDDEQLRAVERGQGPGNRMERVFADQHRHATAGRVEGLDARTQSRSSISTMSS